MPKRVFITGASGCVGHYIVESLMQHTDYDLYLLVRNRAKLQIDTMARPGVTVLEGGMQDMIQYKELLGTMNYAVSAAACWGGTTEVFETNVYKTIELFSYLNPQVCDRAIYFSTASILDEHNQLFKEAATIGTDYIRSKHACLEKIEKLPIRDRLITVFPTLVFGGAANKPYSHISAGLKEVAGYINLIRLFKADASLHFVHGSDIAQMITHLLTATAPLTIGQGDNAQTPNYPMRLVLGTPRLMLNQAIAEAAEFYGKRIGWQINLTPALVNIFIKLFNIKMAPWDYFCLKQRHFTYDVVNPETFGLVSNYPKIGNLLAEVKQ